MGDHKNLYLTLPAITESILNCATKPLSHDTGTIKFDHYARECDFEKRERSGRVLDWRSKGCKLEPHQRRGSSVVRHLPLVLEVPGSIPARGEKNFGVRTRFL